MRKKLREVIDYLEYEELLKMKVDLEQGGLHLHRLVKQKIEEEQTKHEQVCTVCQAKIDPYNTNNFTLLFGPNDLKKRATFCAMDCLEYFQSNLKDLHKPTQEVE